MAITQNTYTGNGSTVLFSFTFPYLETTDVKVSLNGTVTTAYTFANATTIQFNTAPANGVAIRIYRETDDSELSATFYPGSAIRSQDLNDNFTQNLYVTQEVNNNSVNIDGSNPMVGPLNMNGFQIDNLAAPTSNSDAATKQYVDDIAISGLPNIIPSGNVVFTQTGTGAVQRTVESKLQDVVSVLDFIPQSEHAAIKAGTSTYDATAAVQAAVNANDAVYIPSGTYKINSTITLGSNAKVYGDGASTYLNGNSIPAGANASATNSIFTVPALSVIATLTLTANATAGSKVLTVSSASGISSGDLLRIKNNASYDFNNSNVEDDYGAQEEFLYVVSVAGNNITVSSPVSFDYNSASATLAKVSFTENVSICSIKASTDNAFCPLFGSIGVKNLLISDVSFNGNGKTYFFTAERVIESCIKNCDITNTGQSGSISLTYHSAKNLICNNTITNHDLTTSGDGSIVLYYGVNNTTVANNIVHGSGSANIYGIVIHTKSWGNTVSGNSISGIWTGIGGIFGSFNNTISGNAVTGCGTGISLINCRHFAVNGNSVTNLRGTNSTDGGVVLGKSFNCSISSNNIANGPAAGILFYDTTAQSHFSVNGNSISKVATGVLSTNTISEAVFSSNTIYDVTDGMNLGTVNRFEISGNTIKTCTDRGIYVYIPIAYNISSNNLSAVTNYAIQFGTGSNVSWGYVNDNTITSCGGGISTTAVNITSMSRNLFSGITGTSINNGNATLPTAGFDAPLGYFMPKIPANFTVSDGIAGWRRINSTTTGVAGWIEVGSGDGYAANHPNTGGRKLSTVNGSGTPTDRLFIKADGDFLLPDVYNRTSAVGRAVRVWSDGLFVADTSSIRYKTDVETIEDIYSEALLDLRPVWYRSTCEGDNPAWSHWGFIAEEVAEIDPRLVVWGTKTVVTNEDGSRETVDLDEPVADGVAYERFVPHLLNLIKQQKTQIESLDARLTALEKN